MARTLTVAAAQTGPVAATGEPAIVEAAVAMIDEDGRAVGRYRKTHVPACFRNDRPGGTGRDEKRCFAPGGRLEGDRRHLGRCRVVDPLVMVRAEAGTDDPGLLVHEIDLDEVVHARAGLAGWRDRRPDLYGPLVG